jgi:flagellar hook-length control protein FliK
MPELIAVSAAPPPLSAPSSAASSPSTPTPPAGDGSGHVFGKLLRGLTGDSSAGKGKRDGDDPLAGALQALAGGATPAVSLYSQAGADATDTTPNGSGSGSAPRGSAGALIAAGSTASAPASPASARVTPPASASASTGATQTVPPTSASAQATPPAPSSSASASTPLGPRLSASAAPMTPDSTLGATGVASAASASATQAVAAQSADAAAQADTDAAADTTMTRDSQQNARSSAATTLLPPGVTLLQIATSASRAGDQPATVQPSPAPPPASPPPPPPPLPPLLSGRSVFVRRAETPNATFSVNLAAIGAPSQPAQTTSAAPAQSWSVAATPLPKNAAPTPQSVIPTQATGAIGITAIAPAALNAGQQTGADTGSMGDDAGAQSTSNTHAAGATAANFGAGTTAALDTSSLAASLALTIRSGVSEARLQLRPAGLGEVHVQITTSREGVVLRLAAESTAAGDLLREHIGELRDALASHGVTVTDLHVLPNQPAQPSASNSGPAWQDGGRRASRDPQDGSNADAPPQDDTDTDGQGG